MATPEYAARRAWDVLIGIDQGTSATTVAAFDDELHLQQVAQRRIVSVSPRDGWYEHDPVGLEAAVIEAVCEVLEHLDEPVVACGFANQGESVLAWDSRTLEPLTPVIVWNDRRAESLASLLPAALVERTGLRGSSYFCAPKYAWLLRNDPRVIEAAQAQRLSLGTTDTWLLARFGITPRTDDSTASRTLLYDLREHAWSPHAARAFDVPFDALAPIVPSIAQHGAMRHPRWKRRLPLYATLVDQPAALAGHGLAASGDLKITYGTGAFVVVNAGQNGDVRVPGLLTSVAWSEDNRWTYAIDGGVFSAGSAIDWAVENGVAPTAEALVNLAHDADPQRVLFFVPALSGLGAPWWDRNARAHFAGDVDGASNADRARAVLDGIALRVADIIRTLQSAGMELRLPVRVDGGLTRSDYLIRRQADLLGLPLQISPTIEATARGAAALSAVGLGLKTFERLSPAPGRVVEPKMDARERENLYACWLALLSS